MKSCLAKTPVIELENAVKNPYLYGKELTDEYLKDLEIDPNNQEAVAAFHKGLEQYSEWLRDIPLFSYPTTTLIRTSYGDYKGFHDAFKCKECGYLITLDEGKKIDFCPGCGRGVRLSLYK